LLVRGHSPSRRTPAHGSRTETSDAIAGRHRKGQALRERSPDAAADLLEVFAENATDVLWTLDVANERLEFVNPAFERAWGDSPGSPLRNYSSWLATIHPAERAVVTSGIERSVNGEASMLEFRVVRADGGVRSMRGTFFPIRDERGAIARVGGVAQDISGSGDSLVYVVDGEDAMRQHVVGLLREGGYVATAFASSRQFLEIVPALVPGCVVFLAMLPTADAAFVPSQLKARRIDLPVVVIGRSEGRVEVAVRTMRAGAADWLEMPVDARALLGAVASVVTISKQRLEAEAALELARSRVRAMPVREREVLQGLIAGKTNKEIARDCGISHRTIEVHRARAMQRLGARTVQEAVLLAIAAGLRRPEPAGEG
jgi:PAS domain S-box-containing protein